MQVGDLVKYSEEATDFKNRLAAVHGDVSEWLGVIVDENPSFYFVKWMNQHYYDSEWGVAESKEELVVVS